MAKIEKPDIFAVSITCLAIAAGFLFGGKFAGYCFLAVGIIFLIIWFKWEEWVKEGNSPLSTSILGDITPQDARPKESIFEGTNDHAGEIKREIFKKVREAATLPEKRPLVVPVRYDSQPGYFVGLFIENDGEPAFDVSIPRTQLGSSVIEFMCDLNRLTRREGEKFIQVWVEQSSGTGLAGGIFEEMVRLEKTKVEIQIRYKDADNRWYQTICLLERDVLSPKGIRVGFVRQELWHPPTKPVVTLRDKVSQLGLDIFAFLNELGPVHETKIPSGLSTQEAIQYLFDNDDGRVEKVHHGYMLRFKDRAIALMHELGEARIKNTELAAWEINPPEIQREKHLRAVAEKLIMLAARMDIDKASGAKQP